MRFIPTALLLTGLCAPALAVQPNLSRVMLSSGGVGYFEYSAPVSGDDTLEMDVPLGDVDDILKSLVVFDPAGGVASVELPGRDARVQAFADAPFGPEALDSAAGYLNALRGTDVTVQGPRPMTGRILRAEVVTETIDTISMPRTRVTLLGADGLRQFLLEDADGVQVTDPTLRARIEHALEAVRRDANASKRHLVIHLKGTGDRTAGVGYVAAAPLWKTTWRLMLPPTPANTARLQGWATLENQSGTDWKGVMLTLRYGNPVTFRQALYRSYFVNRPEVPVEILGQVLPDIDTRAQVRDGASAAMAPAPAGLVPAGLAMGGAAAKAASMARSSQAMPAMAPPAEEARAAETPEETSFTLPSPIDLPAGHSADVPILDRTVPATRVGLVPFRQTNPLASIRIRNDGTRALPAGALTLYDSGPATDFAGDARLGGLPAGETRLLSFARDLRTKVETRTTAVPAVVTAFSVADGVLSYTARDRQTIQFTIQAPEKEARDLLLEIARSADDQTVSFEDPRSRVTEQTATAFRIAVSVAAGQTRTLTAWLDRPERRTVALVNGDDAIPRLIVSTDGLNPAGRAALKKILDLRKDLALRQDEVTHQQAAMRDVEADEDRLRKDLAVAEPLRTRLIKALDADENKIETIRKAIDDARAEVDKARRALTDAIATLKI